MQAWAVQELGLVCEVLGFLVIVWEWWKTYDVQGHAIARTNIRSYLGSLRSETDPEQKIAIIRRMRGEAALLRKDDQHVVLPAINVVATAGRDEDAKWDAVDKSLIVGIDIAAAQEHPRRRNLMGIGVGLVIVGFIGQFLGSWPGGAGWLGVLPTSTPPRIFG